MTDVHLLSYATDETSDKLKQLKVFKPVRSFIIALMSLVVVSIIAFLIVPDFRHVFKQLEIELPEITIFVLGSGWWICMYVTFLTTMLASFYFKKSLDLIYILLMAVFIGVTIIGLFLPLIVIIERLNE